VYVQVSLLHLKQIHATLKKCSSITGVSQGLVENVEKLLLKNYKGIFSSSCC
jgi:hypothetical protein